MHVYLPTTLTHLAAVLAEGSFGPAPIDGFAVTPGLRTWFGEGDVEELEYAASSRAAAASLVRIAGDPAAPRRRVVLVVDVDESLVDDPDGLDVGAVEVEDAVPAARIVSALVDDVSAVPFVTRVLDNPDGENAASDLEDHQLLWFAAQEIAEVLAEQ